MSLSLSALISQCGRQNNGSQRCPSPQDLGTASHGRGILQTQLTTLRWRDDPALPQRADGITRILIAGMWGELVQFSHSVTSDSLRPH